MPLRCFRIAEKGSATQPFQTELALWTTLEATRSAVGEGRVVFHTDPYEEYEVIEYGLVEVARHSLKETEE